MTLFYGTWKIMDSARVPCMTYFASMTQEDDKKESPGVELLGRWSVVPENEAFQKADLQTEDHCGVCSDKRQVYLEEIKNKELFLKKR